MRLGAICKEHGNDPGELINILHTVQGKLGYLPKEVQELIAMELGIPAAKVYGVVTFYSFFTMKPKGKYPISVCMGTACYVRGAEKVLDEFKRQLGIEVGETTADGLFARFAALRGCLRSRSGRDGGPEGIRPPHAVERQGHHRRIRKPGTGGLTAFLPTCRKGGATCAPPFSHTPFPVPATAATGTRLRPPALLPTTETATGPDFVFFVHFHRKTTLIYLIFCLF